MNLNGWVVHDGVLVRAAGRPLWRAWPKRHPRPFAWIEPEVAEWAATVPDGLLDPDVWLTPIATLPS